MKKDLERVSGLLCEMWNLKEEISEIHVNSFFGCILENLTGTTHRMLSNYRKLSDAICELWQYREIDKMSSEQAFLYGSIWGSIKLLRMKDEKVKKQQNMAWLVKKYLKKDKLLKYIYENPGINHKSLAEKLFIAPSQLSQQILSYEKDGLITDDRIGREKYYYLLEVGESVYQKISKEKANTESVKLIREKVSPKDISSNNIMSGTMLVQLDCYDKCNCLIGSEESNELEWDLWLNCNNIESSIGGVYARN